MGLEVPSISIDGPPIYDSLLLQQFCIHQLLDCFFLHGGHLPSGCLIWWNCLIGRPTFGWRKLWLLPLLGILHRSFRDLSLGLVSLLPHLLHAHNLRTRKGEEKATLTLKVAYFG